MISNDEQHLPLAQTSVEVDDGLGALDVTKAKTPCLQHLVGGLGEESADVDVGLAALVLEGSVKRLQWRRWSRNGAWNGWLAGHEELDAWRDITLLWLLLNLHTVWTHHGGGRWRAVREDATGRAVDGNTALSEARISSVRRSGRLIVLVRRDRVPTRGDEGRDLAIRASGGWCPVL